MSVSYYASSNQPVQKAYNHPTITTSSTFQIWTPGTGKSIILSDIALSTSFKGTVKLVASTDLTVASNITPLFEFVQGGSSRIVIYLDTPIQLSANQAISGITHTGGAIAISLGGFEQD